MSAQPKQALTEEGYLALERDAESKSEFYDGMMVAMAGARAPHNDVVWNLVLSIGNRLAGSCRGYGSDMRVRAPLGFDFYPDVSVVCGEREFLGSKQDVLLNPVLIGEVLSPSTEGRSTGAGNSNFTKPFRR